MTLLIIIGSIFLFSFAFILGFSAKEIIKPTKYDKKIEIQAEDLREFLTYNGEPFKGE